MIAKVNGKLLSLLLKMILNLSNLTEEMEKRLSDQLRYLTISAIDEEWGIVVTTVGYQFIPPKGNYPLSKHPDNYNFKPQTGRILNEYQLVYITKGSGYFSSQSCKMQKINAGTMILLFPGEWHTYYPNYQTGWSHYWIGFCGPEVDSWMTNEYCSKESPVFKVGINDEIVSLFRKAIDVANEEPTLYQRVLSGLVTYLVALMCSIDKNLQVENDDFSSKIDYACVLMKELIDQPVSMQEIAKKAGMGYSLFRKLFKEQKNYAPVQYFQNLKIQKAIELLTTTTIPVKEIAYRLDFESPAYFSARFKKQTGKSPIEYREEFRIK